MMRVVIPSMAMAAAIVQAQPAADKVTSLPGIDKLPSEHYSGYITGNDGAQLHYYMVYAEDVDPSKAPVILWTNGGPGCSSLEGWGYEQGPFRFRKMGEKKGDFPYVEGDVQLNDFAWNKKANVVFLEQPAGVGFSYMPEGGSYATGDVDNAKNNYVALQALFSKFPNFKSNPLYLSGESYAGIYIPTLAHEILNGDDAQLKQQLAGMVVGNGVTADAPHADVQLYYQGLSSFNGRFTTNEVNGLNPYGLQRGCYQGSGEMAMQAQDDLKEDGIPHYRRRFADAYLRGKTGKPTAPTERRMAGVKHTDHPHETSEIICTDAVTMTTYLNRADVQKAMHVNPQTSWGLCAGLDYSRDWPSDMIPIYNAMMQAGKKVLMYVGASDAVCPWTDQAEFIPTKTDWVVTRPMEMWNFDDASYPFGKQVGGSVMQLNGTGDDTASGIWFTTMRGCGHMVPMDCPAAAAYMVDQVVSGDFWNQGDFLGKPYKLENGPACGASQQNLSSLA